MIPELATVYLDRERVLPGMVFDGGVVLEKADIHRHPHTPLLTMMWSMRAGVNPYDGAYVAVATALDVPLVTTDRKLTAAPDLPCTVELV